MGVPPLPGAGAGLAYDQWVDSSVNPAVIASPFIGAGGVLQTLSRNNMGVVDGTAYFVILGTHGAGNAQGRFVETVFGQDGNPICHIYEPVKIIFNNEIK